MWPLRRCLGFRLPPSATRVLAGEHRRLRLGERVGVRLHMMVCKACPRFTLQVTLMRRALNRWKADVEG